MIVGIIICVVALLIFLSGIRIVRPVERGLIERLGKFKGMANPGFNWIIPIIDSMICVNITERMIDVEEQTVQTSDKLNTIVDAVVYYQIKNEETQIKASQYNVDNHRRQITSLARTTLRAVMGNMNLTDCIQKRDTINLQVEKILDKETDSYGVRVLRVEVQKIEPPQDVVASMNNVVKAEQDKIAAKDTASALEIKADGTRRAAIKEAEGTKQAAILEAEGKSKAFELVNKAFTGNAQILKRLEVTENSLKNNSKIILTEKGISPTIVINEGKGLVIPVKGK